MVINFNYQTASRSQNIITLYNYRTAYKMMRKMSKRLQNELPVSLLLLQSLLITVCCFTKAHCLGLALPLQ